MGIDQRGIYTWGGVRYQSGRQRSCLKISPIVVVFSPPDHVPISS